MINATAARVYRLSLSGHTFLHVGDDGGLFEKPIETKEIILANSETVRFIVRYSDYPGKWMYHCHILDHEDVGMMGILQIQ